MIASLAALRASAVEPDWMPLRPGEQWVYEVHRDHSYIPENASINRVFHAGRSELTVGPAGADRLRGIEVREATRLQPTQGGGSPEFFVRTQELSFDGELRLYASGQSGPAGSTTHAIYSPPLRMLPTTRVGESWKVGVYRDGASSIDLQGEVVAVENLDRDPACSGCLKVRYWGPVEGNVPVYQGNAAIESGRLERLVWLKRGVGVVREVTTMESELKLPDGHRARTASVESRRLLEHQIAK